VKRRAAPARGKAGAGKRAGPGALPIRNALLESAAVSLALLVRHHAVIERMSRLTADTLSRGRTVFLCGNGGSAAEAQHLATEFVVRFARDRRALAAVALTADSSVLTAAGNDYGFERVFARQIEALGRRGDLLIALSTSGRSRNVLEAVRAARVRGMRVLGLTGRDGRGFARRCDVALAVPSRSVARIQEAHLLVGHLCCERAETIASGRRKVRSRARAGASAPRGAAGKRRAR
jgi:D-sedoheptulose 7-phosphate isomerase